MQPVVLMLTWLILFNVGAIHQAPAATYYVDGARGNDGNTGLQSTVAFRSLTKANMALRPGDTVAILAGTYTDQSIRPVTSGTSSAPITYRPHKGARVALSGVSTPIDLTDRNYIRVYSLAIYEPTVSNQNNRWAILERASRNEIAGCEFFSRARASGDVNMSYVGLLLTERSSYNQIVNNIFWSWGWPYTVDPRDPKEGWGDQVRLTNLSDHNLVSGNKFVNAGHNPLSVNSSYNIIRKNLFNNNWHRGLEVAWMIASGDAELIARRNIVEGNMVIGNRISGLQLAAADTIIRGNVFANNGSSGLYHDGWGGSPNDNAPHSFANRIYHNTFVSNGGRNEYFDPTKAGIEISQWGSTSINMGNTVYKNNLFAANDRGGDQIAFGHFERKINAAYLNKNFRIIGNCVSQSPTIDIAPLNGSRSFTYYTTKLTEVLSANKEEVPRFLNEAELDYRLAQGSGCVNGGVALTTAFGGGSASTVLTVQDARYFSDGNGMVEGDRIVVGGVETVVRSVSVNDRRLTLRNPISWRNGAPVHWRRYVGSAPDAGAYELVD